MLGRSLSHALALLVLFGCTTTTKRSDDSLVNLANEYAKDGLLREAADTYHKALDKQPNHLVARRNLAIVLVKSGAYKSAISQFEKVVGPLDSDYDTNFYLAEAYRAEEKYAEAIYRYQKALTKKENSLRTLKALAWSYYKIRYYDEALQITRRMNKISKDDPQVAVITARTLLKIRRPKAAMQVIKKAKRSSRPESLPYFHSVEGDILASIGRCKDAIGVYAEALKVQPLLAGSLLGVGRCYVELGDVERGMTYLVRSVRIKPSLAEAYYYLGQAEEARNPAKAIAFYRQFRKHAGKDPEFLNKVAELNEKISKLQSVAKTRRSKRKG